MKAILFPLLTICQYKKKSLLDFHYWILSTPAWEHSPRIKEQMAHIMGVPKQLKQLPTLQTSWCSYTRDLHTVTVEPKTPQRAPGLLTALHCPMQRHQLTLLGLPCCCRLSWHKLPAQLSSLGKGCTASSSNSCPGGHPAAAPENYKSFQSFQPEEPRPWMT